MRVGSAQAGRRWAFWHGDRQQRAFEGAPETGLGVHWDVPASQNSTGKPPDGFLKEVARLFGACVPKFEPYMDARRILVIEQHGDMRYMGAWWWKRVLDVVMLPTEIQELWDGMFDWLDDYQQGWTFEKLYPSPELVNLDLSLPKPQMKTRKTLLRQKRRLPHKSAHNALYEASPVQGAGGGIRVRDVFWDVSDFVRASGWYLMVSMSSDW